MEDEGRAEINLDLRDELSNEGEGARGTGTSHSQGRSIASSAEGDGSASPNPPPPPPPPQGAVLLMGKCMVRETGNATTLARLRGAVRGGGWEVLTRDLDHMEHTAEALLALLTQHNIVAVVGLHAYRTARVLLSCQEIGVPYVVVFGGTDVNECAREAAKREVMDRVVAGAKSLVAFDSSMRDLVLSVWPSLRRDAITVVPQAVHVDPEPHFDVLAYLESADAAHAHTTAQGENHHASSDNDVDNRSTTNSVVPHETYSRLPLEDSSNAVKENHHLSGENGKLVQNETRDVPNKSVPLKDVSSGAAELPARFHPLVLLVAGLRPVKDVLYIAEAWSRWQQGRGACGRLLILGPALDPQYAALVHARVARLSGVRVCPSLAPRHCQAVMKSATVLVNSSRSESMSNAILEAMMLGTPVLARDILGNTTLITHGHTGLLYASPEDFIRGLETLLRDAELRTRLVTAARERVAQSHSLRQEKDAFLNILKQAVHQL